MVQATLIFLLGFLAAGFLAVLVAPAIWRRAVVLTRRRVEAALPLSMAEIRADKDAMRAEYAVAIRRLEMTVKALREEMVARSLEIGQAREEARHVTQMLEETEAARAALERQGHELHIGREQAQARLAKQAEEAAGREQLVARQATELESLGAMYDEASFAASSRQIDLVAQEAHGERMRNEIAALREAQRQADAQLRQAGQQVKERERALREEKRKTAGLERKMAKMTASLSDAEERLQRRARDLQRLRGTARSGQAPEADTVLLRERIKDLAAAVVSLTAQVEGPDSEINKMLAAGAATESRAATGAPSLAARIRALQKQAVKQAAG